MLQGCEEFESAIRKFMKINFLKDDFKTLADIEKTLGEKNMRLFLELSDLASKMYFENKE